MSYNYVVRRMVSHMIEVNYDCVVICGVKVPRPKSFAVGDWYDFWNKVKADDMSERRWG